jgi:D-threo-aldose 1-dehydrogenase
MRSVSLAPNVSSTRIGFGCGGLMQEPSKKRRRRLLDTARDHGILHFDVARMYGLGAAEAELGRFARSCRADIVIATKFGIEASAPGRLAALQGPARRILARYPALREHVKRRSDVFHLPRCYDAASARRSLDTSLRELGTDYVDLLFLHGPLKGEELDSEEISSFLVEAREAGKIRAWGVAGEREPCIEVASALIGEPILQVRADIFSRADVAARRDRPIITFGVLSGAISRIHEHLHLSAEARERWRRALGATWMDQDGLGALLIQESLAANERGVVLLSTTRPERLDRLGAVESPSADQIRALREFRQLVHKDFGVTAEAAG